MSVIDDIKEGMNTTLDTQAYQPNILRMNAKTYDEFMTEVASLPLSRCMILMDSNPKTFLGMNVIVDPTLENDWRIEINIIACTSKS